MKQIVMGTAGHIDHGKTSLVKALTGIETDRLKEEKERGITIELGFAFLNLPSGERLGIVDVPGHEKFVKNMVAGATGIDFVVLVIAADEGVMPQTKEHFEICKLLGIKHGLVVLTKIDMVDEEWLELVREDVFEYLEDSFLDKSPVLGCSSVTGKGIPELIKTLDKMVSEIPPRDAGHIFRIPTDRVFTMKGFGTVITGTTISGTIKTGAEVTIYPQELNAKIRTLQVHGKDVNEVCSGLRTAINLQGIEKVMVKRGDILAQKESLRKTYMIDGFFDLLKTSPRVLKNRAKIRFHSGTSEIMAIAVLLDRDELKPGESCYIQIRLDEPTAVLKKDRFVLRSYSPVRTIGGGEVLHPLPNKKKRFSDPVLEEMKLLHKGNLSQIIEKYVAMARFEGLPEKDLPFLTNTAKKKVSESLQVLKATKRIIKFDKEGNILIHSDFLKKAQDGIIEIISQYHEEFPLKIGIPKEEVRSRTIGVKNLKLFNFIILFLKEKGIIVQDKEIVHIKGHKVFLAQDQEKVKKHIEEIYRKSGLQPPYFKDIKEKFNGSTGQEVLEVMIKDGILVKVKEELYFYKKAVLEIEKCLISYLKEHGEITTGHFKTLTNVSRKYAIPLIEYFDRNQVTVRVGDNRVLRKNR